MDQNDSERMHCMEVWGGNQATHQHFETAGLNVWIYSRPFRGATAGGDVYYLSACASGRITRMLLADVSGHGELVSNMAVSLRDLIRRTRGIRDRAGKHVFCTDQELCALQRRTPAAARVS